MQEPNKLLAILSKMAQKPEVKFDQLYPKLYNVELWQRAYEGIAAQPGNMTAGIDGSTIDGMGMKCIEEIIANLKASSYKPQPVRRVYIKKANGKLRPLGIPSFRDKLLQTVVKKILEAIYEPTFSDNAHGFRPNRSCHTALMQVKKMNGVRWWIEGDIVGFFDNLNHDTILKILAKRITDKRFLHLIQQLLQAGYVEEWQYHKTYSGTPQGGNLSPLLSNIYLNEFDQYMVERITGFTKGERRQANPEYRRISRRRQYAKEKARQTGEWQTYKMLTQKMLTTSSTAAEDPDFRRMYYCRYADDFVVGIVGDKADAQATKSQLGNYLKEALQLELSAEKTLITHAGNRIRFLGYDIQRGHGKRKIKVVRETGAKTQRTCSYKLQLLIPPDKVDAYAKEYGLRQGWRGRSRNKLICLSELEILMTYNAEIRGFLGYYALADNWHTIVSPFLWLTTTSFFKTLAAKRRSTVEKVAKSLKRGANQYVVSHLKADGTTREYKLVSSTKDIARTTDSEKLDVRIKLSWLHHSHTELGQRLNANQCEWCGTQAGRMEVHHIRKLKNLEGKQEWERQMIRRKRKTMVLCKACHSALHAGKLTEANRIKENRRAGCLETCKSGSEGRAVKPDSVMS